jgi:type IV pilus assembly protein PilN
LKIEINLASGKARRRQVNFKFSQLKPGKFIKAPPLMLVILGGSLLLCMTIMHFYQNYQIDTLDQELGVALADSAALSTTIQMLKEIRVKKEEILRRIDVVKSLDKQRTVFPKLMDQVSMAVPDLVWLTKWTPVQADTGAWFELKGESFSNLRVAEFMKKLERSSLIDEVTLLNTHEKIEEGISTMVFTLKCRFLDGSEL